MCERRQVGITNAGNVEQVAVKSQGDVKVEVGGGQNALSDELRPVKLTSVPFEIHSTMAFIFTFEVFHFCEFEFILLYNKTSCRLRDLDTFRLLKSKEWTYKNII